MTPLADGFVADALSGIASVLEVPVHVAALVLLLVLALELGRGVTELWRRHRPGRLPLWTAARETVADPRRAASLARSAPTTLAGRALEAIGTAVGTADPRGVEDALTEYELGVQRRLDGTRLLVRAAPALGLMGTLIPLAPGLEALGRGDIGALADDLRTAFAATVIGLLVGTVAFALTLVRTRLYTEDLAALERALAGAGIGGAPGQAPNTPPAHAPHPTHVTHAFGAPPVGAAAPAPAGAPAIPDPAAAPGPVTPVGPAAPAGPVAPAAPDAAAGPVAPAAPDAPAGPAGPDAPAGPAAPDAPASPAGPPPAAGPGPAGSPS